MHQYLISFYYQIIFFAVTGMNLVEMALVASVVVVDLVAVEWLYGFGNYGSSFGGGGSYNDFGTEKLFLNFWIHKRWKH